MLLKGGSAVPVITIDGPAGSGKGTVSSKLGKRLGWHFLDSGAIYRAFAFIAVTTATRIEEAALLPLCDRLTTLRFVNNTPDNKLKIFWEQRDITEAIRTEEIGRLASQLSAYSKIREALLHYQRAFREAPGLVADGRDMGTIVFPDAQLKIFLVASLEERAKRRYLQLKARGKHVSLVAVRTELEQRDNRDKQRAAAPLKAAKDAFIIDTTHLSIEDVLQLILDKL